jgi:hypothetical protein
MDTRRVLRLLGGVVVITLGSLTGERFVSAQEEVSFRTRWDFKVANWPGPIAVGDFNGDGHSDLATVDANAMVSILLGRGDGTFEAAGDIAVGGEPTALLVDAFNSNGQPDLAMARSAARTVIIPRVTLPPVVDDRVSFNALRDTFLNNLSAGNCPAGYRKRFRFDAQLALRSTNNSRRARLTNVAIVVSEITNNNLVLNAVGGPRGAGAVVRPPRIQGYIDGILRRGELVTVRFRVCLRVIADFALAVDVRGVLSQ